MAIFSRFWSRGKLNDGEIATLRFTVIVDKEFESRLFGFLQETHERLEEEIRGSVSETLGRGFIVSRVLFARGSIEIFVVIAAIYVGISRYKNFAESVTLLVGQLRRIIERYFQMAAPVDVAVAATWLPSPMLQQQSLAATSASREWAFALVLGYLIVSHAVLLAVVIWRVLQTL